MLRFQQKTLEGFADSVSKLNRRQLSRRAVAITPKMVLDIIIRNSLTIADKLVSQLIIKTNGSEKLGCSWEDKRVKKVESITTRNRLCDSLFSITMREHCGSIQESDRASALLVL